MIISLLRFRFKDEVGDEDRAAALAAISRTAALESVSFSVIGQNLSASSDGCTHAYCVGIADLAALERYLYDPVHRSGDLVFLPRLAKLVRVGLADDTDPELAEKIAALAQRRLEGDAEWLGLFGMIPDLQING